MSITLNPEVVEEIEYLDNGIPKKSWILEHPESKRYGCYGVGEHHGLAVASSEGAIIRFGEFIDLSGLKTRQVDYDEAVAIALERPLPCTGIVFVDSLRNPKYVKLK